MHYISYLHNIDNIGPSTKVPNAVKYPRSIEAGYWQ